MRSFIDKLLGRKAPEETPKEVVTYKPVVRQLALGVVTTKLHMKKGKSVVGPNYYGDVSRYNSATGKIKEITSAREIYKVQVCYLLQNGAAVTGEDGTTVRGEDIDHVTFKHDPNHEIDYTLQLKHIEFK